MTAITCGLWMLARVLYGYWNDNNDTEEQPGYQLVTEEEKEQHVTTTPN